ncbi:hypothetical protein, conserved [Trypanosoma brucei gambiense DAL972]|uniref:Uncharacterized protein n=1 Tax=Trypanosoma brucei gambiense (strain MHOM/CI/86/DAL972) TaxID=679716 RepID=D0A931_TRYB9|nr:LOW QUALITY PROTEIN: hypothetical protein, conserved [Trypanosoma brucei gambiense DAL972]CBH18182.1 hypothetical protein, conserved [Trypanosoma brucei gambiense DAL972]|eukprot:XP_011780446.1 LOW QUALITY PROTEIN: hypothetical protein, conserved [Trypanosoma brucei gambiense DAL972]
MLSVYKPRFLTGEKGRGDGRGGKHGRQTLLGPPSRGAVWPAVAGGGAWPIAAPVHLSPLPVPVATSHWALSGCRLPATIPTGKRLIGSCVNEMSNLNDSEKAICELMVGFLEHKSAAEAECIMSEVDEMVCSRRLLSQYSGVYASKCPGDANGGKDEPLRGKTQLIRFLRQQQEEKEEREKNWEQRRRQRIAREAAERRESRERWKKMFLHNLEGKSKREALPKTAKRKAQIGRCIDKETANIKHKQRRCEDEDFRLTSLSDSTFTDSLCGYPQHVPNVARPIRVPAATERFANASEKLTREVAGAQYIRVPREMPTSIRVASSDSENTEDIIEKTDKLVGDRLEVFNHGKTQTTRDPKNHLLQQFRKVITHRVMKDHSRQQKSSSKWQKKIINLRSTEVEKKTQDPTSITATVQYTKQEDDIKNKQNAISERELSTSTSQKQTETLITSNNQHSLDERHQSDDRQHSKRSESKKELQESLHSNKSAVKDGEPELEASQGSKKSQRSRESIREGLADDLQSQGSQHSKRSESKKELQESLHSNKSAVKDGEPELEASQGSKKSQRSRESIREGLADDLQSQGSQHSKRSESKKELQESLHSNKSAVKDGEPELEASQGSKKSQRSRESIREGFVDDLQSQGSQHSKRSESKKELQESLHSNKSAVKDGEPELEASQGSKKSQRSRESIREGLADDLQSQGSQHSKRSESKKELQESLHSNKSAVKDGEPELEASQGSNKSQRSRESIREGFADDLQSQGSQHSKRSESKKELQESLHSNKSAVKDGEPELEASQGSKKSQRSRESIREGLADDLQSQGSQHSKRSESKKELQESLHSNKSAVKDGEPELEASQGSKKSQRSRESIREGLADDLQSQGSQHSKRSESKKELQESLHSNKSAVKDGEPELEASQGSKKSQRSRESIREGFVDDLQSQGSQHSKRSESKKELQESLHSNKSAVKDGEPELEASQGSKKSQRSRESIREGFVDDLQSQGSQHSKRSESKKELQESLHSNKSAVKDGEPELEASQGSKKSQRSRESIREGLVDDLQSQGSQHSKRSESKKELQESLHSNKSAVKDGEPELEASQGSKKSQRSRESIREGLVDDLQSQGSQHSKRSESKKELQESLHSNKSAVKDGEPELEASQGSKKSQRSRESIREGLVDDLQSQGSQHSKRSESKKELQESLHSNKSAVKDGEPELEASQGSKKSQRSRESIREGFVDDLQSQGSQHSKRSESKKELQESLHSNKSAVKDGEPELEASQGSKKSQRSRESIREGFVDDLQSQGSQHSKRSESKKELQESLHSNKSAVKDGEPELEASQGSKKSQRSRESIREGFVDDLQSQGSQHSKRSESKKELQESLHSNKSAVKDGEPELEASQGSKKSQRSRESIREGLADDLQSQGSQHSKRSESKKELQESLHSNKSAVMTNGCSVDVRNSVGCRQEKNFSDCVGPLLSSRSHLSVHMDTRGDVDVSPPFHDISSAGAGAEAPLSMGQSVSSLDALPMPEFVGPLKG